MLLLPGKTKDYCQPGEDHPHDALDESSVDSRPYAMISTRSTEVTGDYYLAQSGPDEEFFGVPAPAVGVRVEFDIERLQAAQEISRAPTGDEGLVVHEDPLDILTLPDRLWRVTDLTGGIRLRPSNRWLRCRSLLVVEEVPPWLVMGPRGDLVARVIDRALELTEEQAWAIAALDPTEEQELVLAVWDRWRPGRGSGSPVGCGLIAVHRAVEEAARRAGPHVFGWDEENGLELIVDPAWRAAGGAANAAALAVGVAHLLNDDERRRLMRRWTSTMGPP